MQAKDYLIGFLLATACIITMVSYAKLQYQDMGVSVDPETDNLITTIANKSSYGFATTRGVMDDVRAKGPGGEDSSDANADQTVENNLIKQGWRALISIPRSFTAFNDVTGYIADKAGVPPMWSAIALISITFIIALLLITAVMRSFVNV